MSKFQYKTFSFKHPWGTIKNNQPHQAWDDEINRLTAEGWDVQHISAGTSGWLVFGTGFQWKEVTFVLRKEMAE